VYSLGAILVAMLTGSPDTSTSAQTRRADPQSHAAEKLLEIAARCLRINPRERFQTIGEVAEALKRVAEGV
jgi:hypothetical protein